MLETKMTSNGRQPLHIKKSKFAHRAKTLSNFRHWQCVKTCVVLYKLRKNVFSVNMSPFLFLLSLNVECQKWFFNRADFNSISLNNMNVYFRFPPSFCYWHAGMQFDI